MNEGKAQYTDREIIYRWALVRDRNAIERVLAGRGVSSLQADGCIGFFYIDHTEGISLRIHALCQIEPGAIPRVIMDADEVGEGFVLRLGEIKDYTLLPYDEAESLSLPGERRWLIYHEPRGLHEIRTRHDLDQFRAPVFFDDVAIVLRSAGEAHIPEVVWVILEEMLDGGARFRGVLLNEPDADFGVHEGDMVTVTFVEDEEGRFLVSEM